MSLLVQQAALMLVQCNRETTYGPGCRFLMVLMFRLSGTYVFFRLEHWPFPVLMFSQVFPVHMAFRKFFRHICYSQVTVQLVPMSGYSGVYIRDLRLARDPPATGEVEPPF